MNDTRAMVEKIRRRQQQHRDELSSPAEDVEFFSEEILGQLSAPPGQPSRTKGAEFVLSSYTS
jgi:hypothetical protein